MPEESPITCAVPKRVGYGWRPIACGKPAKGTLADGTPACGLHIGAEKRAASNRASRAREGEAKQRAWSAVEAVAERLRAVGIEASVASSYGGYPSGLTLTLKAAEALIARLAGTDA